MMAHIAEYTDILLFNSAVFFERPEEQMPAQFSQDTSDAKSE
jgi:hypothetical protein